MHLEENTLFVLDLRVKVTQNIAQYPPYHVTYAPVKIEVATSNGLEGYAFTRKWIIYLDFGVFDLNHRIKVTQMLPSTYCASRCIM